MSRTNAEQEQNLLDSVYYANRLISGAWSESKELLNYCFLSVLRGLSSLSSFNVRPCSDTT